MSNVTTPTVLTINPTMDQVVKNLLNMGRSVDQIVAAASQYPGSDIDLIRAFAEQSRISQEQADELINATPLGGLVDDAECDERGYVYHLEDGRSIVVTYTGELAELVEKMEETLA